MAEQTPQADPRVDPPNETREQWYQRMLALARLVAKEKAERESQERVIIVKVTDPPEKQLASFRRQLGEIVGDLAKQHPAKNKSEYSTKPPKQSSPMA
jgi:hypothetical protein